MKYLVLITFVAVVSSIIIVYYIIAKYKEKKRNLNSEIAVMKEVMMAREEESKIRLRKMEDEANDRIRAKEEKFKARELEFDKRVEKFNLEERIRESVHDKTEKELLIECFVQEKRIMAEIDCYKSTVLHMEEILPSLASNISESVKGSLEPAINEFMSEINNAISGLSITESIVNLESSLRGSTDRITEIAIMIKHGVDEIKNSNSNYDDYDSEITSIYNMVDRVDDNVSEIYDKIREMYDKMFYG